MQQRLCGREQEYGIVASPIPRRCRRDDEELDNWRDSIINEVLRRISSVVPAIGVRTNFDYWLGNGSRIYKDGQKLEIAGAEHLAGSWDGIVQEKASELILANAARLAVAKLKIKSLNFYKNNVGPGEDDVGDPIEVTYGSHHNYSYETKRRQAVTRILVNFIPAMLPLSGNGHICEVYEGKFIYCFSQRANHLERLVGSNTLSDRAIVNSREEPLMDPSCGLSRLHLISRDATRCQFQTWLVDTITHLVLRLAEEGWHLPRRFVLKRPIADIHMLNTKFDLGYRLDLKSCRMNVINYNYLFLKAAKQLKPLSAQEKKCLSEWERVLELLKAGAVKELVGELDWATKWHFLKSQLRKENLGLNSGVAFKINVEYHNISASPKESIFAWLEEKGRIRHLVDRSAIQRMISSAPATRAKSRGDFIKRCLKERSLYQRVRSVNWDKAELDNKIVYFGKEDDPFSPDTIFEPKNPNSRRYRFSGNFEVRT